MDNTVNAHQQMIGVAILKCLRWKKLASVPECHKEAAALRRKLAYLNEDKDFARNV